MRREAIALGERLVAQEAGLDRLFAERRITPGLLNERLTAIGATQAALREAHLTTHLAAVEILSPDQVKAYAALRGYGRP